MLLVLLVDVSVTVVVAPKDAISWADSESFGMYESFTHQNMYKTCKHKAWV